MKIHKLVLCGYKRLMLSNIQHFTYSPTTNIQLILGTNGSGKSSILNELSPLPAQSNDFSKDGYKIIEVSHRNCNYTLTSRFKGATKHSFLKDELELNPGGTAQVQKELVLREFNITTELHELLTGNSLFTDMAPLKRREWISRLSTMDYSFATNIYNKSRSMARDQQGALKHIRQRLSNESNNLHSLSILEGIDEKVDLLRNELNLLLSSRTPGLMDYKDLTGKLNQNLDQINKFSYEIIKLSSTQPRGFNFTNKEEVQFSLNELENSLSSKKTLLERLGSEYSNLESIVSSLTQVGDLTSDNIEGVILEIQQEKTLLSADITMFRDLTDLLSIRRDTNEILDTAIALVKTFPDNSDRRLSPDNVKEAKNRIRDLQITVDRGTARLVQIEERIKHIKSAKENECPKCKYVWKEGYSQEEIRKNEEWITEHTFLVNDAIERIKKEESFIEEADEYLNLFKQFRGLVSSYPRLKPLWDYFLDNSILTNKPAEHIYVFYNWQKDVELNLRIEELDEKLKNIYNLSKHQSELGGSILLNQHLTKLYASITDTTLEVTQLRSKVSDLRQYNDKIIKIHGAIQSLESLKDQYKVLYNQLIESLRNTQIDLVIKEHQNELGIIQRHLTEKNTLVDIIKDLEVSNTNVDLDQKVLSYIATALSPTEGIIAEQLSGFINCLVAQMNSIIKAIWTYDLFILPCGLETGELDYKFPLQVRAADNFIVDIAKGSTAQKEIINFSFLLTVMLYLELEDYPLYLDELGAGFDEQHRSNVMSFVKHLMDSNRHSQLFMVSHYAANHGSLSNCEVMVIDGSNIAVPGEINNHVVFG